MNETSSGSTRVMTAEVNPPVDVGCVSCKVCIVVRQSRAGYFSCGGGINHAMLSSDRRDRQQQLAAEPRSGKGPRIRPQKIDARTSGIAFLHAFDRRLIEGCCAPLSKPQPSALHGGALRCALIAFRYPRPLLLGCS